MSKARLYLYAWANSADPDQTLLGGASDSRLNCPSIIQLFSDMSTGKIDLFKLYKNGKELTTPTSNFQPIRLLDSGRWYNLNT